MTNYERIKNLSIEEMAKFMGQHIDHYRAPYEVKDIYQNHIDSTTGRGLIWIKAFELWLNSEVE